MRERSSCLDFISSCPTPWHVEELLTKTFSPEARQKNGRETLFFRHGGMVVVGLLPSQHHIPLNSIRIYACHTDSPCLKVKQHGLYCQEGAVLLGCEVYGAPILASWIGRPLTITGKVWGEKIGGGMHEWLLPQSKSLQGMIPHVAIHLDRNVNEQGLQVPKQEMLSCMVTPHGKVQSLEELLRPFVPDLGKILFHDLFVVPADVPLLLPGYDGNNWLVAPRLDNLSSVHGLFSLLLEERERPRDDGAASLFFFCNHEEIGSETSEGAYSALFNDIVEELLKDCRSLQEKLAVKARSMIFSCDAAHAVHPLFSEKHDSRHKVFLGKGMVIKVHGQQKYSSPPRRLAKCLAVLEGSSEPYQIFTSRNDIPSGSTVGPILSARLGIDAIDIGIPIIGMHAAVETASYRDIEQFPRFMRALTGAVTQESEDLQ